MVLIGDGDVAGVIAVTDEKTPKRSTCNMGQGRARPKGVIGGSGLALRGRAVQRAACVPATTMKRPRARKWGEITDLDRIYKLEDLAKGDCIFAATGVTSGSLLDGVKRRRKPPAKST